MFLQVKLGSDDDFGLARAHHSECPLTLLARGVR